MGSVAVVGSINIDLVYRVPSLPAPGETVLATGFERHPGGKGNNQVIAAARAGADATFIASIGEEFDDDLEAALAVASVDTLLQTSSEPTGTALITVDDDGENSIVVNSGANAQLLGLAEEEIAVVVRHDVLLLQLEIPIATVRESALAAREAGRRVVLNVAPFQPLEDALLNAVDVLVVNELEAAALGDGAAGIVEAMVVTLGSQGAVVRRQGAGDIEVPAPAVETVVDTTGAGDAFCGAFAAALAEDRDLVEAARFAVCAGALAVQRRGAVPSLPHRAEIDALMARDLRG